MSSGLQNVHVRVNDAASGKPTPVRIRFVGPDGKYYAPFGRLTEFATGPAADVGGNVLLGDKKYCYIDGTCEIRLPVGDIEVEIRKGLEYVPLFQKVRLPQGKLALRFEIKRWSNLREQGWYSGDTQAFFLTPHAALLEGAGEDLAVVNLLARGEKDTANLLAFSGQRPALSMPGHLVVVNTYNSSAHLGDLALLNCHRVVYPLTIDLHEPFETNLADWCQQCHRKGGLVVAAALHGKDPKGEAPQPIQGEVLADAVLGLVDVLDVARSGFGDWEGLKPWEELLACGYRLPLSGGSQKHSNTGLLGSIRTYAYLGTETLEYGKWIEAVRAGRTFVSSGPLLRLTLNDCGPGSVIQATSGQTVRYRIEAQSLTPFQTLELVHNGVVVAEAATTNDPKQHACIEGELRIDESGWFYARCAGPYCEALQFRIAAVTSPVHVEIAERPLRPPAATVHRLIGQLEETMDHNLRYGRFESDRQRERMQRVYREAQAELQRRLPAAT